MWVSVRRSFRDHQKSSLFPTYRFLKFFLHFVTLPDLSDSKVGNGRSDLILNVLSLLNLWKSFSRQNLDSSTSSQNANHFYISSLFLNLLGTIFLFGQIVNTLGVYFTSTTFLPLLKTASDRHKGQSGYIPQVVIISSNAAWSKLPIVNALYNLSKVSRAFWGFVDSIVFFILSKGFFNKGSSFFRIGFSLLIKFWTILLKLFLFKLQTDCCFSLGSNAIHHVDRFWDQVQHYRARWVFCFLWSYCLQSGSFIHFNPKILLQTKPVPISHELRSLSIWTHLSWNGRYFNRSFFSLGN